MGILSLPKFSVDFWTTFKVRVHNFLDLYIKTTIADELTHEGQV